MEDLLLLLRRHLALDPDEALLRAEPFAQLLGVDVGQHGGDQLDRLVLVDDAARLGEHRHRLDVGRQNLAVAVEQIGPRAGDRLVGRHFQRLRRIVRDAERDQLGADADIGDRHRQGDEADAAGALVEAGRKQPARRRAEARQPAAARRGGAMRGDFVGFRARRLVHDLPHRGRGAGDSGAWRRRIAEQSERLELAADRVDLRRRDRAGRRP